MKKVESSFNVLSIMALLSFVLGCLAVAWIATYFLEDLDKIPVSSIYHISIDPSMKPSLVATLGVIPVAFGMTSLGVGGRELRRRNFILALIGACFGLLFFVACFGLFGNNVLSPLIPIP